MHVEETVAWTLIAATLPFAIAIVISVRPNARPKSISDYFIFGGRLSPSLFLKSSVGYSLQVAAIFLFLLWYFSYGISALLVPLAWFAGYAVVWAAVHSKKIDDFLGSAARSGGATIHGFVGSIVESRTLVVVMALTTVFGVAGTLIGEMDYSTKFLIPALGISTAPGTEVVVHGAILFFSAAYVLWGGFRASVFTDAIQVPLAYVSFVVVVLSVCYQAGVRGARPEAIGIVFAIAVLFSLFWVNREKLRKVEPDYPIARDRLFFMALLLTCLATLAFLFALPPHRTHPGVALKLELLVPFGRGNFLGFGLLGVISLAVANASWQLVDITNLQRLQAISAAGMSSSPIDERGYVDQETSRVAVKRGVMAAGVESAGSWVLTLMLGIAGEIAGLSASGPADLAHGLVTGTLAAPWVLPIFAFSLITFMLSTLSGLISAIAYVSFHDIGPAITGKMSLAPQGGSTEADDAALSAEDLGLPRAATMLSLSAVYVAYVLLRNGLTEGTAAALYAVYAVQLSAGLVIILALFRRQALKVAPAIASILAGWFAAVWSARAASPVLGIPIDSWYVVPPLVALSASVAVYGVVALMVAAVARARSRLRTAPLS